MAVMAQRQEADFIFYDLARSLCPECRRLLDAQVLIRNNKVFMRKRCPDHGQFDGLIYSDAEMFASAMRYNKPGSIPLRFSTDVKDGCPFDCGLCPEHKQHACLGIIEVNTACNLNCPVCFANAGPGYNLTLAEVERMLDRFVECEGVGEVIQFSGGEPSIHPEIIPMLRAAKQRPIKYIMLNTNGVRIATDDRFLAELAEIGPTIYMQFDGLTSETSVALRGEDLIETKKKALDRLASVGLNAVLVAAIEHGVNEHEIGPLLNFALDHPGVRGIVYQPVTHTGRHPSFDPLQRMTIPDVAKALVHQTGGQFVVQDFIPVPCCFPTCTSVTYAYVEEGKVTPLPRLLNVEDYLDYLSNRTIPDLSQEILRALEGLWSASAVPGTQASEKLLATACCNLDFSALSKNLFHRFFMVMIKDFMDLYTFNVRSLMKCCVEVLVPDGRMIPFCAYNTVGYREQVREHLRARKGADR